MNNRIEHIIDTMGDEFFPVLFLFIVVMTGVALYDYFGDAIRYGYNWVIDYGLVIFTDLTNSLDQLDLKDFLLISIAISLAVISDNLTKLIKRG